MDAFRMEQVFRNLMENSLGACSDPTTIEISCHELRHNGAPAVCVSYRDNGPGLTNEQVKRVFEAFYTTKSRGTGLGMAIAHRILQAHQGTIAVGSHNHGGAEFVITVPCKDP
jgi:signal transduction histidine kinase